MDMVVRLLGDGKSFAGAMDSSRRNVGQLNSALDKLTAAMEAEASAGTQSSRQTQILALADKGASAAKVEYALALASQLDSQDELTAAMQRAAAEDQKAAAKEEARKARIEGITASLERQLAVVQQGGAKGVMLDVSRAGGSYNDAEKAAAIYNEIKHAEATKRAAAEQDALAERIDQMAASLRLEQEALSSDAATIEYRRLRMQGASHEQAELVAGIVRETAALKEEAAALDRQDEALTRANQAGVDLVATVRREAATFNMTSSELREFTAAQNGASAAAIKNAREIEFATGAAVRWDRQIQKQIQSQRQAQAAMGAGSKGQLAAIESIRGLEDAVQGYTNNGLKGMIVASSNNLGQIGALIGKSAGLYLMLGSTAALLGVSLLPKLMEWADGTAKVREETLKLNDANQKFHDEEMRRIDERYKANFSRGRDVRRNEKLLAGEASSKDLNSEAERLREQIEVDKEAQIIERRKQTEIQRNSALVHMKSNPYEQRSTIGERTVGGGYIGGAIDWSASWFSSASEDPEIAKKQRESWETAKKEMAESRSAQAAAAKDQDTHQALLARTEAAARERAKQERRKEIDEIIEKEREKNQKSFEQRSKQAADLADKERAFQADMLAKNAALEAKAADDARKEQVKGLEASLKVQKKNVEAQSDRGGNELSAVEANSSEAFKRVFEATRGGGGETNPQRVVAENTAKMLQQMRLDAERAEKELEALKELKPFKTGPA